MIPPCSRQLPVNSNRSSRSNRCHWLKKHHQPHFLPFTLPSCSSKAHLSHRSFVPFSFSILLFLFLLLALELTSLSFQLLSALFFSLFRHASYPTTTFLDSCACGPTASSAFSIALLPVRAFFVVMFMLLFKILNLECLNRLFFNFLNKLETFKKLIFTLCLNFYYFYY